MSTPRCWSPPISHWTRVEFAAALRFKRATDQIDEGQPRAATTQFARLAAPVIPATAERIAATVGATDLSWPAAIALDSLPAGQPVHAPEVLFKKIEDAQTAEWSARFGGADQ